jgi:hypothetical protein
MMYKIAIDNKTNWFYRMDSRVEMEDFPIGLRSRGKVWPMTATSKISPKRQHMLRWSSELLLETLGQASECRRKVVDEMGSRD